MNLIRQINYIFSKRQKIQLVFLMIIMIINSLIELLGIAAIMPFVNVISNPGLIYYQKPYKTVFDMLGFSTESQFVLAFAFALILIYVVKNACSILFTYISLRFSHHNKQRFIHVMMDCYMEQTYLFHVSKNISELSRNISSDTASMFGAVLSVISLLKELLICLLLIIYLFILDKSITIGVVIMLSSFSFIFLRIFRKKTYEYGIKIRDANFHFGKSLRQAFEGIKEIKIVNRENFYVDDVMKYGNQLSDINIKMGIIDSLPRPLFETICVSSLLSVVTLKIARGVDLSYFIPVLSAFAVSAFRILPSASRITTHVNSLTYNKASIDSVYNDLKEIEQLKRDFKDRFENKDIIDFNYKITIKNVIFTYPISTKPVIDGASFEIQKNSSVALIGSSGAGKTTMADIILGLLEPQQGHVFCDNEDVYEKPYGWHRLLGYIPQTIYLVDDTIKNNILFGIPEKEADNEKVWRAIEDAQLGDFVRSLEKGVDTVVGERGVRLSGGQRQRIGIARALYNDPPILVLDEATSALDTETETAVMEAIDALHGNRTMIIIAHRLTTIRNCDYIYEIKDKKAFLCDKEEVFANL